MIKGVVNVTSETTFKPLNLNQYLTKVPLCLPLPGRGSNNQTDNDGGPPTACAGPKRVSSICFNMPAVGLGARPPSIISTSTDEGGFNEPSPEIKAKLKPAYTFDLETTTTTNPACPPVATHPSDLHYVDVSHRLNPDGSEGENSYIEPEMYSIKSTMMMDLDMSSSRGDGESVVYATIKPEVPMAELNFRAKDTAEDVDYNYRHSPQSILDPTRPTLATLSNGGSRQDSIEDKRLPDLPIEPTPPPRPPLPKGPPLMDDGLVTSSGNDVDVVEYADASDEDVAAVKVVAVEKRNGGGTEPAAARVNGLMMNGGGGGGRREDVVTAAIPESMTADEAERLLSSR